MVKSMRSSNISVDSSDSMHEVQTLGLFLVYYFQLSVYSVITSKELVSVHGVAGFIYKATAYREFISKAAKQTRPTRLEKF